MPITKEKLQQKLDNAFPQGSVNCNDLAGDDDHWEVVIEDESFAGKTRIQQHKMVQSAVKDEDIHALSIRTIIPKEN